MVISNGETPQNSGETRFLEREMMMMSVRTFAAALATGTGLLASAAGAQTIYYEDGDYLYAVPAETVVTQTVEPQADGAIVLPPQDVAQPVFDYNPVVQPVGGTVVETTAPLGSVRSIPVRQAGESYRTATQVSAPYPGAPASRNYPVYRGAYAYQNAPQSGYLPGGGQLVSFDREAWLAECRARVGTYEESDRARLIGTVVGAAAGGLIGNRVAGSGNRLGGTAIGAGTGAVAGSVAGDAIDDREDARRYRAGYGDDGGYCAAYLDDYLARASQAAASTTTTVPGQQYFLVPVTVEVAQQPVYVD